VALALLAIGATRGLLRSFPVWSITWIVFFVTGLGGLAQAAVVQATRGPSGTGYLAGFLTVYLAGLIIVLAFAALLSRRAMPLAMFAVLLYLARSALATDTRLFGPIADTVSWLFASATLIEAAFVMLLVARFVRQQDRRLYLYLLAAIVLLDAFMTALSMELWARGISFWERAVMAAATIGGAWLWFAVIIPLAWGASKLATRRSAPGPLPR
jgi:hypothetical protein